MKYKFDGFNWLVRLEKGERLVESLTSLVDEAKLPSCWLNGIGAASSAEVGFYDLDKKKYNWQMLKEPLEITGLQGNLTWVDGKPFFHIHGTFSRQDLTAVGGHVKELVVAGTCEVLLHKWYTDNLTRKYDDDTGLNLIDL